MSELLDWFKKRREAHALKTMRQHLATAISIVDDLEKGVETAADSCEDTCDQVRIIIVRS